VVKPDKQDFVVCHFSSQTDRGNSLKEKRKNVFKKAVLLSSSFANS